MGGSTADQLAYDLLRARLLPVAGVLALLVLLLWPDRRKGS